ncbi:MAG: hypothetical protein ACPHLK_03565, partial [Gammaproteobacteria bacterium]
FIDPSATSYQTFSSSFWSYRGADQNGTGGSSDLPDGDLVEKGGIAQGLRTDFATDQSTRKLYTCTTGTTSCIVGSSLSATPFSTANDGITNAGLGLGSTPISSLTGNVTTTVNAITDTKTLTSLSSAAGGITVDTVSSVTIDGESISSLTTDLSSTLSTLSNSPVVQSLSDLDRGTGGCKSIATATVNGHGYSTGQVVHISGVGSTEYNGTFTITVLDVNRFTYNTGDCSPANNPNISSAVSTTTSSSVTATVTGHGFSDGDAVTLAGVVPTDFNSTYNINVIDSNTFSFTTAAALAPVTDVSSATASGPSTTATATTSDNNHTYSNGDLITITGASPNEYNGTFTIANANMGAGTFTYTVPNALANASGTISASKGSLVTVNKTTGHGFSNGQTVTIAGATPSDYNGTYTITFVDANNFTYITTNAIGTTPATGTITASSGFSTVASATLADHGLATGDSITVSGAAVNSGTNTYDGTFTVTKIDNDTFTYTMGSAPTDIVTTLPSFKISTAVVALVTQVGHGYSTGNSITISGAVDAVGVDTDDYNGTFTITKTSDNTYQYTVPLLVTAQGDASGTIESTIETTTAYARVANHGFADGATVAIAGATPAAFNGNQTITLVDNDNFTYTLASAQGDASGSMTASSGTGSTGERADLINWVRGTDNNEDENLDSDNTDIRASVHGDVLHSRPAVINYNRHGNDDDVYVFYGSNDGIFRAIKGGFNQSDVSEPLPFDEAWGFVIEEHFSQFERLRNNEPTISSSNKKPYFTDGSIGVYTKDVDDDGILDYNDGDKVWLFLSMHRGGRLLYALDVSNPSDPKLLWRKSNADWPELGQTWSLPLVKELAIDTDGAGTGDDDDTEVVLIFGAGYDPTVEDVDPELITSFNADADTDNNLEVVAGTASYERSMGRGIFVVDAQTGNPLWQAGPAVANPSASHTFLSVTGMDYAIPSDVVVIPDRNSTTPNRAYVGDTGGNMWRVDMSDSSVANWTVTKIASVADHTTTGSATDDDGNPITIIPGLRKFLFPPDVVYSEDGFDAVLIGSGDREHPFDTGVVNRFYMFKDSSTGATVDGSFTTLAESDLFDATSNCIQAATACSGSGDEIDQDTALNALTTSDGWYITLSAGEKVVGNAVTLNNVTFFNTNVPSSVAGVSSCESNLGEARQYQVQYSDATAIADQNIDGSTNAADRYTVHAGGGYLPSPVPVVVEIDGEIHQGVISGVSVEQPPGTTLNTRLRKFWYKEIE